MTANQYRRNGLRDCERKVSYSRKREARTKLCELRQRENTTASRVYKCPHCKKYHITSQSASESRFIRKSMSGRFDESVFLGMLIGALSGEQL